VRERARARSPSPGIQHSVQVLLSSWRGVGAGCKVEGLGVGTAQATFVSPEGARVISTLEREGGERRGREGGEGKKEGYRMAPRRF
jgi:hypothetical protein